MMRYQRVSPDCLPLSNGKKPNSRPSPSRTAHKEDNNRSSSNGENRRATPAAGGGGFSSACTSTNSSLDGGISKGFRFRSPSRTHLDADAIHSQNPSPNRGGAAAGGDVLLQWGQRKRSRVSRAEIRPVTDDSSSSSGQGKISSANKIQRRALNPSMPPPPPPPPLLCGVTRGTNPRNGLVTSRESSGFLSTRNLEDRSTIPNGSPSRTFGGNSRAVSRSSAAAAAGKRSPPLADKKINGKDMKQNGVTLHADHHHRVIRSESTAQNQPEQEANGEKPRVEVIEWPRIYLALSRKEKEEDFLAMKGTKLPHRPRKRAKNVDKALQYCFPGMWLSDLTKSRYEVREKKCVKKQKRRGLKGMENMDTDSE